METSRGIGFRLNGVTLEYSAVRALHEVDLEVVSGEMVGLVGPSGAGKTSLLTLLAAGVRPTRGSVHVDGRDLAELSPRELRRTRTRLGFVHQDHRLVPNLRVSQNVVAGRLGRLSLLGTLRQVLLPPASTLEEVHALLERVGIEEKLFARSDRLSGGQRQRVAIARALYQEPGGLLADEPVASVDPARAEDTLDLLTSLSRERGLTLVVSLHDFALARQFFPRLVGLRDGRVAFDRPTAEVRAPDVAALYRLEDLSESDGAG